MHKEAREYLISVKDMFPGHFDKTEILDVGALNINGTNRHILSNCDYIGLDIIKGPNVDVVCPISEYRPGKKFKTIICTEVLEHDFTWKEDLLWMYELLKPGGILVVTCANIARREHGTVTRGPGDSPATNDYYRNIDSIDIINIFPHAVVSEGRNREDLYFYVFKI